jgi:hypothetical protein
LHDKQSERDYRELRIDKVGVRGLRFPIRLRDKAHQAHVHSPAAIPMSPFAMLATTPSLWRTAMTMSKAMNHLPIQVAPIKPLQDWLGQRTLPESHGGDFRKWFKTHKKG